MSLFTKQIGEYTFNFNRIITVGGIKYHVSVWDGSSSHYFIMNELDNGWEISTAPQMPDWIMKYERKISQAIKAYIKYHRNSNGDTTELSIR
jgi:hypothetical protein